MTIVSFYFSTLHKVGRKRTFKFDPWRCGLEEKLYRQHKHLIETKNNKRIKITILWLWCLTNSHLHALSILDVKFSPLWSCGPHPIFHWYAHIVNLLEIPGYNRKIVRGRYVECQQSPFPGFPLQASFLVFDHLTTISIV